jgi:hypothetical protein
VPPRGTHADQHFDCLPKNNFPYALLTFVTARLEAAITGRKNQMSLLDRKAVQFTIRLLSSLCRRQGEPAPRSFLNVKPFLGVNKTSSCAFIAIVCGDGCAAHGLRALGQADRTTTAAVFGKVSDFQHVPITVFLRHFAVSGKSSFNSLL